MKHSSRQLAGLLTAFAIMLDVANLNGAEIAGLLHDLNMTGYSRITIPPEFSGRTLDGHALSLSSMQGKVVLLNFWASWCLECRPEMPLFERLHRQFSVQGLAVIGINAREDAATIRRYTRELELTFPLILDLSGQINSTYGVVGLPTTFLIGRDGRAVGLAVGPRDWSGNASQAVIRALLAGSSK